MKFDEYQALAQRTSATKTMNDKVTNGLMGLNGEAGEAIDLLKKHIFQGHPIDTDKLKAELGDVLWYCAEIAEAFDWKLSEVAEENIAKLKKRYPHGFDSDHSIHRGEYNV